MNKELMIIEDHEEWLMENLEELKNKIAAKFEKIDEEELLKKLIDNLDISNSELFKIVPKEYGYGLTREKLDKLGLEEIIADGDMFEKISLGGDLFNPKNLTSELWKAVDEYVYDLVVNCVADILKEQGYFNEDESDIMGCTDELNEVVSEYRDVKFYINSEKVQKYIDWDKVLQSFN